ncbi:MAG: V-type ATPase subunit [Candidatus Nezhaarchaeales archaeon]
MEASRYAYGVARVRAKRSFMLKPEDYESMLRAPTFHQALAHLRSISDLGKDLPQTDNPQDIEKHLLDKFTYILWTLVESVGDRAKDFLETAFSKYEYETLKALLKAKFLELPRDEVSLVAPPLGRYSGALYASLVSARNVEQAIDLLPDANLRSLLRVSLRQAEAIKSPIPIEVAIDKLLYNQLWRLADELMKSDRKWIRHLLGIEIDIKNILVLVRGKFLGLQPSALEGMLLPLSYRLQLDLKSLASQSTTSVLQSLAATYYGKAISPLARDAMEIERNLQLLWIKENEAVFLHYPFTLAVFYAFANLKYAELKDVRAILLSKLANLPPQKVLPLIIRHRERMSL